MLIVSACAFGAPGAPDGNTTASAARFGKQRLDASALADPIIEQALLASGIDRIAVQSDGVVTSLRTFAEIQINLVTGKSSIRGQHPVYTLFSMIHRADDWSAEPIVPVNNARLSKALGLNPKTQARISLDWALSDSKAVDLLGRAEEDRVADKALRQPLQRLRGRLLALKTLPDELRIVPLAGADEAWTGVRELQHAHRHAAGTPDEPDLTAGAPAAALALDNALRALFQTGRTDGLDKAVASMLDATRAAPGTMAPWALRLDRLHTSAKPFHQAARLFLLAALLCLFVAAAKRREAATTTPATPRPATIPWIAAMAMLVLAETALVAGLVSLALLTRRMPVANMYESLLFTLAAFGIAGIVFEARSRVGWLGSIAAGLLWLLLTCVNNLPVHMTRRAPLVAVLDSLWLNFHVTTVMVSYGLFLLGFLFCILYLVKEMTGNRPGLLPDKDVFEHLNYRCIQIGWPLLGIGIFLGAVWANTAWGSYWSWDPKETWSLITWLAYAAYLHLRMNVGWTGRRSIIASMVGFLMVLITYFGVSYLPWLAGGLHSYA